MNTVESLKKVFSSNNSMRIFSLQKQSQKVTLCYFKQMANKTDGALRDKFDVVHDLNDKLDRMLKRSDIDQEII